MDHSNDNQIILDIIQNPSRAKNKSYKYQNLQRIYRSLPPEFFKSHPKVTKMTPQGLRTWFEDNGRSLPQPKKIAPKPKPVHQLPQVFSPSSRHTQRMARMSEQNNMQLIKLQEQLKSMEKSLENNSRVEVNMPRTRPMQGQRPRSRSHESFDRDPQLEVKIPPRGSRTKDSKRLSRSRRSKSRDYEFSTMGSIKENHADRAARVKAKHSRIKSLGQPYYAKQFGLMGRTNSLSLTSISGKSDRPGLSRTQSLSQLSILEKDSKLPPRPDSGKKIDSQEPNSPESAPLVKHFRSVIRIYPPNKSSDTSRCLIINDNTSISMATNSQSSVHEYDFDRIFVEGTSTSKIFKSSVQEMILDGIRGFENNIVFYGDISKQEATLYGTLMTRDETGILTRTCEELLSYTQVDVNTNKSNPSYLILISFLEITNENVYDLLAKERKHRIDIELDTETRDFVVDSSQHVITNINQAKRLILKGKSRSGTMSRSHHIISLTIERTINSQTLKGTFTKGKINFICIAERQTDAEIIHEAPNINRSHIAIHNLVKNAKSNTKRRRSSTNIPSNNSSKHLSGSKLTQIISQAFGGNSKTLMIGCVCSGTLESKQTFDTLMLCHDAMSMVNQPKIYSHTISFTMMYMEDELRRLQKLLRDQTKLQVSLITAVQELSSPEKESRNETTRSDTTKQTSLSTKFNDVYDRQVILQKPLKPLSPITTRNPLTAVTQTAHALEDNLKTPSKSKIICPGGSKKLAIQKLGLANIPKDLAKLGQRLEGKKYIEPENELTVKRGSRSPFLNKKTLSDAHNFNDDDNSNVIFQKRHSADSVFRRSSREYASNEKTLRNNSARNVSHSRGVSDNQMSNFPKVLDPRTQSSGLPHRGLRRSTTSPAIRDLRAASGNSYRNNFAGNTTSSTRGSIGERRSRGSLSGGRSKRRGSFSDTTPRGSTSSDVNLKSLEQTSNPTDKSTAISTKATATISTMNN